LHEELPKFTYRLIKPNSSDPEYTGDSGEAELLTKFQNDEHLDEASRLVISEGGEGHYYYYAAIRSGNESLVNEPARHGEGDESRPLTLLKITMPTTAIEKGMHLN